MRSKILKNVLHYLQNSMAAYYSSVLQSLSKQVSTCYEEINKLRQEIRGTANDNPNSAAITTLQASITTLDQQIKLLDEKYNAQLEKVRSERATGEATITTKLEQYASSTIKNRIELSLQNFRAQILNELEQKIDEVREEISNSITPLGVGSESRPPVIDSIIENPVVTQIDIDALTKESLEPDTSDFTFNTGTTKRRVLKKK